MSTMSVDMEQASEPYGDIAQFDQEGYHLDLDAGVDTNDIDLQVETFDTEVQHQTSATDPATSFAKQTGDIDIGFDEEDMGAGDYQEQAESTHHQEVDNDPDGNHGDVEYGDEIGYDEDDDGGDDGAAGTAIESDVSALQATSDEPKLDDEPREEDLNENDSDYYHDDASLHDEHAGQDNENNGAALNGSTLDGHDSDLAVALTNENQEQSASSISELEQIDELSGETPEIPFIEVRYKENSYSLFGSPEDDPDSYFLSEPKHLDIPLYEFLIAIRHVVEDELSSHDELSIRIPPLGLEFGERSRESFLRAHNFREIHDCWTRLFPDGVGESSDLVLHLVVCHDPEHRFAELLAQAELPRTSAPLEGSGDYPENQAAIGFNDEGKDVDSPEEYADANTGGFGDNSEDKSAAVSKADSGQSGLGDQEDTAHRAHSEEDTSPEVAGFQVDSLRTLPDGEHSLTMYEGFDLGEYPISPKAEHNLGEEEEDAYFNEHHMADRDEEVREEEGDIEDQEFPVVDDDVSPEVDDNYEDGDIVADVEVTATGEAEVSVIGAGVETTSEFYGNSLFFSSQLSSPNSPSFPGGSLLDMIDYSDDGDLSLPPSASTRQPILRFNHQSPRVSGPQPGNFYYPLINNSDDEWMTSTPSSPLKRKLGSEMLSGGPPFKKAHLDAQVGEALSFTASCPIKSGFQSASHSLALKRVIWIIQDEPLFSTPTLSSESDLTLGSSSSPVQVTDDPHSSAVAARESSGEFSRVLGNGFGLLTPDDPRKYGDVDLGRFLDFELDLFSRLDLDHTDIFTQDEEINIDLGEDPSLPPHEPRTDPDSHEDTTEQNGHRDNNNAPPTDQQDSTHTSATSTVDGDEIDYEDHELEGDSFAMNPETDQQLDLGAGEADEIDWRNDEDEDPAVLPTAESPSSISAKRSRTDDADILVDEAGMCALPSSSFSNCANNETDHKRRRT